MRIGPWSSGPRWHLTPTVELATELAVELISDCSNVRMMRTLPRERGRYHTAPSLSLGTSRSRRERLVSCSPLEYRITYVVIGYPYRLEVGPCGGPRGTCRALDRGLRYCRASSGLLSPTALAQPRLSRCATDPAIVPGVGISVFHLGMSKQDNSRSPSPVGRRPMTARKLAVVLGSPSRSPQVPMSGITVYISRGVAEDVQATRPHVTQTRDRAGAHARTSSGGIWFTVAYSQSRKIDRVRLRYRGARFYQSFRLLMLARLFPILFGPSRFSPRRLLPCSRSGTQSRSNRVGLLDGREHSG